MTNLRKKKKLIARTLGIGIGRIALGRKEELEEAITRQDIRDLAKAGVIKIKDEKGKKKRIKKKRKIRKKLGKRKRNYLNLARKLRAYLKNLKKSKRITRQEYYELRKKIKGKIFRSLAYLKEAIK